MQIHGIEGMSADNIRDEVNRGGRLVIYTYCVSILVMTFKRPAGIRLIKAGHSPAAASWPWIVISLLFGWWGIPWGPIYTIETIYRNLCGGIDVTDDFMRQTAPTPAVVAAASAAPAPAPARVTSVPAGAGALRTPPPPPQGFNFRVAGLLAGGVCLTVLLGLSVYCWARQQELPVVLVSGLDEPTTVKVNGQTYPLPPHGVRNLTLPEGEVTVESAGETQRLSFSLPFFDHLTEDRVGVINPDRAAVLVQTDVIYYRDGVNGPADEEPGYKILVNQPSYFLPKPDYLLAKPDEHISMPSGSTRTVKTHLDHITGRRAESIVESIAGKNGYPAAREHLMIRARHESGEAFLVTAMRTLKPEDQSAFFKLRLADRPVLVEWHRYYQNSMEHLHPEHDLVAEYRALLQAEPTNGALMYLLARETTDEDEAARLWQQAVAASPACAHAYGAMAYDAMSDGRFADALESYTAAEKAGLVTESRRGYRRQALLALGRADVLLAELAEARKASPVNLELVDEEIRATLFFRHDRTAAEKLKADCLKACQAQGTSKDYLANIESYLDYGVSYQLQDWARNAKASAGLDSPYFKFEAACTTGDFKQASELLQAMDDPGSERHLLLYLLAQRAGDPAAETHFQRALELMKTEDGKHRRIASLLAAPAPDPRSVCAVRLRLEDKRILLAALGVHDQANRAAYFDLARKLNIGPAFPYYFLQPILGAST
jgi:hypothetical protein